MNAPTNIQKGSLISKTEAGMLQAIAVLLMVFHHLFAFSDRIHVDYVMVFNRFGNIETILSYFARICVAMFAFCSGYGMYKSSMSASFRKVLWSIPHRIFHFYQRYWVIFLTFVPLGFALGVYSFQPQQFIRGFLGLSCQYNAEWWYVSYYLNFLLLFPVLWAIFQGLSAKRLWILHGVMAFCALAMINLPNTFPYSGLLSVLIYFVEGMYIVASGCFEHLDRLLGNHPLMKALLGLILCAGVFVLRTLRMPEHLLVPIFIFGLMLVLKHPLVYRYPGVVFRFVGKYSTYIWLTHTFFGYYYFQKLTFLPRFSPLIFLFCTGLCIVVGIAAEQILRLPHFISTRRTDS